LPQVTRFPQRAKNAVVEAAAPEVVAGKKYNVKRPSLELVDSHSFVTDEKDKVSKGPRIIETELSKSELFESNSKSSVDYASRSTTASPLEDDEDTTPLMEKVAIDLYAIIANENAKEDDKKSFEATTIFGDEDEATTEISTEAESDVSSTTPSTTTTTAATTTTTTTSKLAQASSNDESLINGFLH